MSRKLSHNPNGAILWIGESPIDGAPVVCIVTGLKNGSGNRKTGAMVQTWIIRADVSPTEAVKTGADVSICDQCPHRGREVKRYNRRTRRFVAKMVRTCYVNVGQAPRQVYECFRAGRYLMWGDPRLKLAPRYHGLRIGSYGDPTIVPLPVWHDLLAVLNPEVQTGYTHRWRVSAEYRHLCMASADTAEDVAEAGESGWRSFFVAPKGADLEHGAINCPSDPTRTGKLVSCADCGQCSGSGGKYRRNIYIRPHGPAKAFVTLPVVA